MSAYENVVVGKLKLKGKALNVAGGVKKKKKKHKHRHHDTESQIHRDELQEGGSSEFPTDPTKDSTDTDKVEDEGNPSVIDDQLTPAERRYIEQRERIDTRRLAKTADKSHRDRIEDFNQYLANLSEHYDIPKVGPG